MTTKQDLIAQLRAMGMPDWAMARVLMTQAADTLEALQAEVKHLNLHLKATQSGRDAALARLAITEEANSMLLARNKWLEHTLEVAGASPQQSPLLQFCTCEDCKPMECEGCRINRERREQPPAAGEAAREYMTGYSDGREWAGATNQAQPSQALELPERWVSESSRGHESQTYGLGYKSGWNDCLSQVAAINAKEQPNG